jgi:hypothetical protein
MNAVDQPDQRLGVPPHGTEQPGAGRVEKTTCPWAGRGAPLLKPGEVPPAPLGVP